MAASPFSAWYAQRCCEDASEPGCSAETATTDLDALEELISASADTIRDMKALGKSQSLISAGGSPLCHLVCAFKWYSPFV